MCPTCGNVCSPDFKAEKTKELRARLSSIKKSADEIEEARKKLMQKINDGQFARDSLEKQATSIGSLIAVIQRAEKLPSLKERLKAIGGVTPESNEAEIRDIRDKMESLRLRSNTCAKKRQSLANTRSYAKNIAEAELKHKAALAQLAAFKETTKILEKEQENAMESAFKPILSIAEQFSRGIFKTPLEYNDGDLGRYEKGVWVSIDLFSGTEKAIAFCRQLS